MTTSGRPGTHKAPSTCRWPRSTRSRFQPDVPVVAVCRSGNRSGKAAELLARGGIDVVNMAGGMTAWAAAGLPVVAADGSPGEIV